MRQGWWRPRSLVAVFVSLSFPHRDNFHLSCWPLKLMTLAVTQVCGPETDARIGGLRFRAETRLRETRFLPETSVVRIRLSSPTLTDIGRPWVVLRPVLRSPGWVRSRPIVSGVGTVRGEGTGRLSGVRSAWRRRTPGTRTRPRAGRTAPGSGACCSPCAMRPRAPTLPGKRSPTSGTSLCRTLHLRRIRTTVRRGARRRCSASPCLHPPSLYHQEARWGRRAACTHINPMGARDAQTRNRSYAKIEIKMPFAPDHHPPRKSLPCCFPSRAVGHQSQFLP